MGWLSQQRIYSLPLMRDHSVRLHFLSLSPSPNSLVSLHYSLNNAHKNLFPVIKNKIDKTRLFQMINNSENVQ